MTGEMKNQQIDIKALLDLVIEVAFRGQDACESVLTDLDDLEGVAVMGDDEYEDLSNSIKKLKDLVGESLDGIPMSPVRVAEQILKSAL
jgi:hypothetical protein